MKKRLLLLFLPILAVMLVFSGCFSSEKTDSVIPLYTGQMYNFYQGEGYTYSSSNKTVADVSEEGIITALSGGNAIITAKNKSKTKVIKISVIESELGDAYATIVLNGGQVSDFNWVVSGNGYVCFYDCEFPVVTKTGYNFVGWFENGQECSHPSQYGIYTAEWEEIEFNVTYVLNGGVNGNNPSTYKYFDGDVTLEKATKENAYFDGWYLDDSFTQKTDKLVNKGESYVLYACFKEIWATIDTCGVEFESEDWIYNEGVYICLTNVNFPSIEKTGYTFLGWKIGQQYHVSPQQSCSYTADWKELEYAITYHLDGGTNGDNPSVYKYFDQDIALKDAVKSGYAFMGWYLDSEFAEKVTVIVNNKQSWELYAYFIEAFTADIYFEGNYYNSISVPVGNALSVPDISIDGYFILWYTDANRANEYDFSQVLTDNITIYGFKNKELTKSFFGYKNNRITEVNNLEEMQYFLEYVCFNEYTIAKEVLVNFDFSEYLNSSTKMSELLNKTTCPFLSLGYSHRTMGSKTYFSVNISDKVPDEFLTYTSPTQVTQYKYYDFGCDSEFTSSRSEDYDDFKYNSLEQEVSVKNSNQLFFALEHRVKPIPVAGSNAEIALNKCKAILRRICDDSMTDEQKIRAIYKYLVMNVDYVLPENVSNELYYDAFYMEGILNNGAGVCDGISKTFSALCNIEGIRCVRTASSSHAWNEVFVNGYWFTIDATHGNLVVGSNEYFTFENYLINEEIKATLGYTDILRTEIYADGVYDYYTQNTFTYNGVTYDFNATNRSEISALMLYCESVASEYSLNTFTVDFVLDYSLYFSLDGEIRNAKPISMSAYSFVDYPLRVGDKIIVILILSK